MVKVGDNVLKGLNFYFNGILYWNFVVVQNEWNGDVLFFFILQVINVKDKVDESFRLIFNDLVSFL